MVKKRHVGGLWIIPNQSGGNVMDAVLRPTYNSGGPSFSDLPANIWGQILYSTAAISSGTLALAKTIQLPSEIAADIMEPNAPHPDEVSVKF